MNYTNENLTVVDTKLEVTISSKNYPIKQHYHFYQKLQEIQKSLNLTLNFIQLNELYNEITALRVLLGLPEITPLSKIIEIIQKEPLERIAALGIRHNSLLLKILLIQSTMKENAMTKTQERLPLTNDLDLVIFQILKSYGPLSRSELVQLTNTPRSTIYDSLQRLVFRGLAIQFSEKRSPVGRPVTLFDVIM